MGNVIWIRLPNDVQNCPLSIIETKGAHTWAAMRRICLQGYRIIFIYFFFSTSVALASLTQSLGADARAMSLVRFILRHTHTRHCPLVLFQLFRRRLPCAFHKPNQTDRQYIKNYTTIFQACSRCHDVYRKFERKLNLHRMESHI